MNNKEQYLENRKKELQRMKEWRAKNSEHVKQYRKKHHLKNRDIINQHKKEYRKLNPDKIKAYRQRPEVKIRERDHTRKYRLKNPNKGKEYYQNNRNKIKEHQKIHAQIPEVKARRNEMTRIWRKANPSSNRHGSIDLQLAMNNVRRRDGNTCQWQGCCLNHKQVSIHVHHIFPREKHPEFELIEQYMICYCANHHGLWHRYNDDPYSEMIPARYQENGRLDECPSVRGRD